MVATREKHPCIIMLHAEVQRKFGDFCRIHKTFSEFFLFIFYFLSEHLHSVTAIQWL